MSAQPRSVRIQVTSSAGWGGRESLPLAIHRLWQRAGHTSILLAGKDTPLAKRGADFVTAVPRGRFGLAKAVRKTVQQQCSRGHNRIILISHFTRDLGSIRWALRGLPDVKLIVIKHVSPGPPKTDPVHRWIYRRVDCLLGVSGFVADKCKTSYPIPSNRIGVWHPGVDVSRFGFDEAARATIRSRHGADGDQVVIGYVGRVTPNKGLEWLLDAFLKLAAERSDVTLWIVGGASEDERGYEQALQDRVAGHPERHRVVFTGYQESVHQYMSALDVFVAPSCEESFGLTTVEAMLASRPVVGFRAAGTAEIVVHGATGILADPHGDRADALREALATILRDRGRATELGRGGRERAESLFSHSAMIHRLEAVISTEAGALQGY